MVYLIMDFDFFYFHNCSQDFYKCVETFTSTSTVCLLISVEDFLF